MNIRNERMSCHGCGNVSRKFRVEDKCDTFGVDKYEREDREIDPKKNNPP